jgi:hypothetical protein
VGVTEAKGLGFSLKVSTYTRKKASSFCIRSGLISLMKTSVSHFGSPGHSWMGYWLRNKHRGNLGQSPNMWKKKEKYRKKFSLPHKGGSKSRQQVPNR